jgi:hypothetical protein
MRLHGCAGTLAARQQMVIDPPTYRDTMQPPREPQKSVADRLKCWG